MYRNFAQSLRYCCNFVVDPFVSGCRLSVGWSNVTIKIGSSTRITTLPLNENTNLHRFLDRSQLETFRQCLPYRSWSFDDKKFRFLSRTKRTFITSSFCSLKLASLTKPKMSVKDLYYRPYPETSGFTLLSPRLSYPSPGPLRRKCRESTRPDLLCRDLGLYEVELQNPRKYTNATLIPVCTRFSPTA